VIDLVMARVTVRAADPAPGRDVRKGRTA
jgi:hypothetical protein